MGEKYCLNDRNHPKSCSRRQKLVVQSCAGALLLSIALNLWSLLNLGYVSSCRHVDVDMLRSYDTLPFYHQQIVDIQISLGIPIVESSKKVITFNPFARISKSKNVDSYPFIISDINGQLVFYVNNDIPKCSTIYLRNENFDAVYHRTLLEENCRNIRQKNLKYRPALVNCSKIFSKTFVESMRLSSFIENKRIEQVGHLMLDTGGSDFSILKDFVENLDLVSVRQISLKCQWLNHSTPLYFSSNDCGDIKDYMSQKFQLGYHLAEDQISCQNNEFKLTYSGLKRKTSTVKIDQPLLIGMESSDMVTDIDIGTLGLPIRGRSDRLITFDPFDKQLLSTKYERHPYIISDVNGYLPFYVNDGVRGCSTLNFRNEHYDVTYQTEIHERDCRTTRENFLKSPLVHCMHYPQRKIRVRSIRLSTFLKQRNITRIGCLKIDAQGSDFAILKDTIENLPSVSFESIIVECQVMNGSIPLYFTSNDCGHIEHYISAKFETFQLKRQLNNCNVKEYNLIYSGLIRKKTLQNCS